MFHRNRTLNQNVPHSIESEWAQVHCCLGLKSLVFIHFRNSSSNLQIVIFLTEIYFVQMINQLFFSTFSENSIARALIIVLSFSVYSWYHMELTPNSQSTSYSRLSSLSYGKVARLKRIQDVYAIH